VKHLSAEELLLAVDGELAGERRVHLSSCLHCRRRLAEWRDFERMAKELQHPQAHRPVRPGFATAQVAALLLGVFGIGGLALILQRPGEEVLGRPQPRLTPGATRGIAAKQFCHDRDLQVEIPVEEARAVFASYGIREPGPGRYEVDLLIPPALGGVPERRNLWPQPYRAGVWNSRVKDALEDHLLSLVCEGRLDLATAQQAMAGDWIASYKHYFGVSQPLTDHFAFVKDPPWE
jgi:hypothetical protein